jgi:adenylate cyclase
MWKMFSGKYFNPKEESRIFMFLDLNASTSLAEKLGNKKFYSFLNDFYHDIAPVIQAYKGDVVEYVGDQVVITWTMTSGVYHARCMTCYKEFEQIIQNRKIYYLQTYGFLPSFKAAIHCGAVMIGEMGKLKKSIKYSGDVLNTTARIEKICGNIGAKMVVTEPLIQEIPNPPYSLEIIKNVPLRGKEKPIDVYRVHL